MREFDYVAEPSIVTAVHLARAMEKPLLVEGDAGVGKTEIAKVMAGVMGTELIRLQCYEGLDVNTPCTSGTTRSNCCGCGLRAKQWLDRTACRRRAVQAARAKQ